ncbi:hypothetical protein CEW89_14940 [Celeribacter ethanolicus]|uniref:SH3b domain-containing protein n=3 Tax=Celeribacter ethanolicus TaxID=1758178 RepID=A0A291GFE8_9RHOB|nr:hypothetical protein CEW89_14940 [Celeribacter ethanolicus]TNE63905.1 MAG: SH3 domain-containing protein [Paracoccaceae bacterium]
MLRLSLITLCGLWAALMVFGRDLSPSEQAAYDAHQAAKEPLMAQISDTFTAAFGSSPARQGEYVPTLAELKAATPEPNATQPLVHQARLTGDEISGLTAQPATYMPQIATTTVTHPEKMAAVLTASTEPDMLLQQVTASRVNVRSGPSTMNEVLGQVVRADIVRVISPVENGWVKISVEGDGVEGYMSAKFLADLPH